MSEEKFWICIAGIVATTVALLVAIGTDYNLKEIEQLKIMQKNAMENGCLMVTGNYGTPMVICDLKQK